ncbi:MAG: FHA domain-containing protein [Clostridiales bacterium]|nr:FHA domain-containing protein [Clostridiales bacterium]
MGFMLIVLFFTLAFLPCYAAFRLKDYRLLGITAVCAVLSFLILPYLLAVILVARKLPKNRKPPFSFPVFCGYWLLILLLYFILPSMKFIGVSMNGFQFFQASSFIDGASTNVVFFLITVILAFILSLLLRQRALFTGELVLLLNSFLFFALLASNLIHYDIAAYGIYLILVLYLLGIAGMYYMTIAMCPLANLGPSLETESPSIPQPVRDFGSEAFSALSQAAGKIGSAAKSGMAEMKAPASLTVCCMQGLYAGASFPLREGESLYLGKDPNLVNLVLDFPEVSRLHCSIYNSGKIGIVQILDNSTNGVYLSNGERLPKNVPLEFYLPCTIFFGNEPQIFEIRQG